MDAVRSILAAVFAAAGLYSIIRLVTARRAVSRIAHVLRIAMSAAMVAMLGPWNAALPEPLGLTLFTAAALWFGYVALFLPGAERHPWFDAGKMLAMVWMSVAMSPIATQPVTQMAGMAMSSGGTMSAPAPTWSATVSIAVGLALLIAAAFQARCLIAPRRPQPVDGGVMVVMATGMACSFFTLL